MLSEERTQQVIDAAQEVADWGDVHRRAWRQGVLPLMHRQLAAAAGRGAAVPDSAMRQLASTATAIAVNNLRLTSALVEMTGALAAVGLPVIAYKGPTLAVRGYGNLALRHFNDLDLLVRADDMAAVDSVFARLGYDRHDPVGESAERAARHWGHHYSFVRDPATLVEVHWRFHKPLFGRSVQEIDVWRAACDVHVAGERVRTLSTQHELLVLATHGSWHGWSQLSWVCDVAELLARADALDPEELLGNARDYGCLRPLLLALRLTRVIGFRLPAALAEALPQDPAVERAAMLVTRRIQAGSPADYDSVRLQLALRPRPRDKVAFALRALFLPTPADVRAVRLPGALFPVYYLLRPLRMALKYRPRRMGSLVP
jgi:hypothetical protein